MKYMLLFLLILAEYSFSIEFNGTKDSVNVGINYSSRDTSKYFIKNNSYDSIALDSAYVIFDVLDNSNLEYYIENNKIEIYWMEYTNKSDFGWYLTEIDKMQYKLIKKNFYPNDAIPIKISPKDSCDLTLLQIGIYLVSAHYPVYPNYLHGRLCLYFNNNKTFTINIYSDDFRNLIKIKTINKFKIKPNNHEEIFKLNGKIASKDYKNVNNIYIVKSIKRNRLANKALNLDCELLRNDMSSEE